MTTIKNIADKVGLEVSLVRDVLKEVPGTKVSKTTADKIFAAARAMKYDLKKLKIGKRMDHRRQTLEEMIVKIEKHTEWDRDQILQHLREAAGMVERVHKRVFKEEFGQDDWW